MLFGDTNFAAGLNAWSTLATALVAFVALLFAWWQIRIGNANRTAQLIADTYSTFVNGEGMVPFYSKIRGGEDCSSDEEKLNRSMTLFDSINYLQTQGLLHPRARAWEYIAAELQYFASNDSVCRYVEDRIRDGKKRDFPYIIIPFTGFPALLGNIPKRYQMTNGFPPIPYNRKELKALVDQELKASRSRWARITHLINWLISA